MRLQVVAVGAIVLVAAGATISLSRSRPPSTAEADARSLRTETHVGAGVLGVMRRPQRAADEIDPNQQRLVADGIADPAQARRVGAREETRQWILPGENGSVCLITSGFVGCPSVRHLDEQGVEPMLGARDGTYYVNGIAVDGISEVRLSVESGERRRVPVIDNAFAVESADRPVALAWSGRDGDRTFEFPDLAAQNEQLRRQAMRELGIPQGASRSHTRR